MRKKWRIYEKKTKGEGSFETSEKKGNPGILLLSHENFKILEFYILPSIDEKDREKSVFQTLEERFLDVRELPFLYFEVLSEEEEQERIFCAYLREEIYSENTSVLIDFVIPTFLLGKCLSSKEEYFIVDYGSKDIFFFAYEKGKFLFCL